MRKYNLNTKYFKEINSKEKAYILGFIYADGCITYIKNKNYQLILPQHAKGREVLEYIKECLGYSGPIYYDRTNKLNGQIFYQDRLTISSKDLIGDLLGHGVIPRKSLILDAPNIEQEFIGSFIRGYFDGDGSAGLYEYKNKHPIITFCGTLKFLSWIKNETKNGYIYPSGSIYHLCYSSKKSIIPVIELMGESPFGMKRKTRKLDEIMSFLEGSDERRQITLEKRMKTLREYQIICPEEYREKQRIAHEKRIKTLQKNWVAYPEEYRERQRIRCEKAWKTRRENPEKEVIRIEKFKKTMREKKMRKQELLIN